MTDDHHLSFIIRDVSSVDSVDDMAQVMAEAFASIQNRTGLPEDLARLEVSRAAVEAELQGAIVAVDKQTGKIVGFNSLSYGKENPAQHTKR